MIEIPDINTEAGLCLYENDVEVYKSILGSFISNIPAVLDKIRNVSSETLQEYKINIHALRGICESICAEEITDAAAKLEVMAKRGDWNGILAGNGELLKKTDILVDNIRNWVEKNSC